MKRTVYYAIGSEKVHRSIKCALSGKYVLQSDINKIVIPENEISVMDYVRGELTLARVCLRCWNCGEDKE